MELFEVLIVDNEPLFRKSLKKTLEKFKCTVHEADNGQEGRDILKLRKFNLVIADIQMPYLSGLELLEWSRKNEPVPMILITGFSNLLDVQSAHEMGAIGFLVKPFDEASLLRELRKVYKEPEPVPPPAAQLPKPEYCKILIDDFVAGSKIPFGVYVRVSDTKFIKVAHSGEDVSLNQIHSYKNRGVKYLYILKEDYHKLVGFNLRLTKAINLNGKVDPALRRRFLKYTGEVIAQNVFVAGFDKEVLNDCKEFVELSLNVISDDQEAILMLDILNSHADFVYAHSLGVSMYGVLVARALGWLSPQTAFKVSIAGLYHDIGKKEIPRAILEKPRFQMTLEERTIYETHPTRGKEILEAIKSVPTEVVEVAYQHHENILGTGFPRKLRKMSIHPMANLIAIVDRFCELAIKSPYSSGMTAAEALSQIGKSGDEFDRQCHQALRKIVMGE